MKRREYKCKILEKIRVGSETIWKVGSGSGKNRCDHMQTYPFSSREFCFLFLWNILTYLFACLATPLSTHRVGRKLFNNNNCVCTGRVPDPTSLFLPTSFCMYVNLVAKGAPKFFKTLAPRPTVLDIPYFAYAYSRTVRPIDLHNF